MNNKMELYEKKGGKILYESYEPLFNDGIERGRLIRKRIAACLFAISLIVALICLAVTSSNDGFLNGISGNNGQSDIVFGSDTSIESEESFEESDKAEESGETEAPAKTDTESLTDVSEEESFFEKEDIGNIRDYSFVEEGEEYIINTTNKNPDISELLLGGADHRFLYGTDTPTVLILHTHTSEQYAEIEDEQRRMPMGVVGVGDSISERLNRLGIKTVHCSVIHDGNGEASAYSRARDTIETMLEIYPEIVCVIDIHRATLTDTYGNPLRVLSPDGEDIAQVKLTVSGYGDGWLDSLEFALSLRRELNKNSQRICMPVELSASRYNSDLCCLYLTVDVGAEGNSNDDALRAAERFAYAFAEIVLK